MNDYDHKVKPDPIVHRMTLLLAGDVGGTKTQLGLYDPDTNPPAPLRVRRFNTLDFEGLSTLVESFLEEDTHSIAAACFGVAGPVRDQVAQLTNVPWRVEATALAAHFEIPQVRLLNDLAATGYAVSALSDAQLTTLQVGDRSATGNAALIAPGTGLGETLLRRVPDGFIPLPSEAGHTDFAARTPRELELVGWLRGRRGRVSYEDVLTGPGLVNLYRFAHEPIENASCQVRIGELPEDSQPAAISAAGLEGACERCVETLQLFVSALGAEAGNLGLRSMATGGVYLGGGIPRKILPALQTSTFLDAFRDKTPMHDLVRSMPVTVIMEPDVAVLGAAIAAQRVLTSPMSAL